MKIVILNKTDFSGNGYNLAEAINRNTEHKAVSMRITNSRFNYPTHYQLTGRNQNKLSKIILNADVVVIREFYELPEMYNVPLGNISDKTIVMSFGGWRFRDPTWRVRTRNYMKVVPHTKWMITSADFIPHFLSATFVPCCIDVDAVRKQYLTEKQENPP